MFRKSLSLIAKVVTVTSLSFVLIAQSSGVTNADTNLKDVHPTNNEIYQKVKLAEEIVVGNSNLNESSLGNSNLNDKSLDITRDPILFTSELFFESIKNKNFEELSEYEMDTLFEITSASLSFVEEIKTSTSSSLNDDAMISPMYLEDELSKAIEAAAVGADVTLSVGNITTAFNNAEEARQIGVKYAQLMGWGTTTWDNPADAYRHFSWNWFNSRDLGVNKARSFGDYHELALVAANEVNRLYPQYTYDAKIVAGLTLLVLIRTDTRKSLTTFNKYFDDASIMDIHNNSWGRKYYQNYPSYKNVADAFYAACYTNKDLIAYLTEVDSKKRSTAYTYWQ